MRARESAESERANEVRSVLNAADKRDAQAEARDDVSGERDMAANLEDWLDNADDDEASEARRLASEDRTHARGDRTSSKSDRDHLAEDDTAHSSGPRTAEGTPHGVAATVKGCASRRVEHGPVHGQFKVASGTASDTHDWSVRRRNLQCRQQPPLLHGGYAPR